MKNQTSFCGKKGRSILRMPAAVFAIGLLADAGYAQNVTLNNGGSTAVVNLGGGTGAIGVNSWEVNIGNTMVNMMQNQLDQQWFWYSVNGGAVQSIDQIGAANITTDDGSTLTALYQNSMLEVQVSYSLQGDGVNSGSGVFSETVSVYNLSSDNLNINFYEYANFNLLQNNENEIAINGQPGAHNFAIQTTSDGAVAAQTIVEQSANDAEAGSPTDVMADIIQGNLLNGTTSFGPGDAAWALEWTSPIAPFAGDSDNTWNLYQAEAVSVEFVPEPATFGLFALGGLAGASFARRRPFLRKLQSV